jgi:UPF0755 protein
MKGKRTVLLTFFAAAALIGALVDAAVYLRTQLNTPDSDLASPVIVEIPHGSRTRDIVGLLQEKRVIRDQYVALAYLFGSGLRHKLQAGEYLFDHPMTPVEVLTKIANGNVYLHKFTVPEGLTLADTAGKWEEEGFGPAESFRKAAENSTALIHDLDPNATSLEGYLFPETYSFPAHTPAKQAVEAMVTRFRTMIQKLEKEVPSERWPLDLRGTVILASIVESEAAKEDERPVVASVYLNRVSRKMLLQCDPTVIYALEQADKYRGKLILADLKFPSPYNTYVTPGLPAGPIMNPGYPSLRAAVQPASTNYLYFVRTVDGRHTFSENFAAHNKAVAAYRVLQKRAAQ